MISFSNFVDNNLFFLAFLYFLGFLFIFTALLIILTESSVHSILYLMFLFLYLTELTILLKMEFLGLIFIIVYIGAVCVLMLFHIKLIKTFIHRFDNIHNKNLFLPVLIVTIVAPLIQIITLSLEDTNSILSSVEVVSYVPENLDKDELYTSYIIHENYTSWVDLLDSFKSLARYLHISLTSEATFPVITYPICPR